MDSSILLWWVKNAETRLRSVSPESMMFLACKTVQLTLEKWLQVQYLLLVCYRAYVQFYFLLLFSDIFLLCRQNAVHIFYWYPSVVSSECSMYIQYLVLKFCTCSNIMLLFKLTVVQILCFFKLFSKVIVDNTCAVQGRSMWSWGAYYSCFVTWRHDSIIL